MSDRVVIALGYFDSVHLGHRKVIEFACDKAKSLDAKSVVFTFDGNLRAITNGKKDTYIYSAVEREKLYKKLGANEVYFAPATKQFLSMDKIEFLDFINGKYDIKAYVCGKDYRFGKSGLGRVEDLSAYAKSHNQQVSVVPDVEYSNKKVSSSLIKEYLNIGDIKSANELLVEPYSVIGVVQKGRKVGRTLGFPTVNLEIEEGRQKLKNGVYKGRVRFDGKEYLAMINYGIRPTFDEDKQLIEGHIVDFNGDLYGKEIEIVFDGYLRDIIKFTDEKALKEQLIKDKKEVQNG